MPAATCSPTPPPSLRGGPPNGAHAAWETVCGRSSCRRTREKMPAATYSPTPPPSLRGGPQTEPMPHGKLCAADRAAGVHVKKCRQRPTLPHRRRACEAAQRTEPMQHGKLCAADRAAGVHVKKCRQRPTLPHSFPCSTIGGSRLNFRVRNGNGCDPAPMTTGKLGAWGPAFAVASPRARSATVVPDNVKELSSHRSPMPSDG